MSKSFQPTRLVGAIAIAMGFSPVIFAEDTTNTTQLDPIVITASKSAEKASEVPARINIIEPKVLEQSPIASLPQLLQTDASINMVQSGGMGQLAEIYLRGTESDHTLVLRDGIRLNNASSGTASLAFIDTTDIKQIEVLKGPASVLYGTDAIGGVIQLVSKTPEKNRAFITGEIGENKTYKSVIGADLYEDGFYAQIRGQRLESDATKVTNQKKPTHQIRHHLIRKVLVQSLVLNRKITVFLLTIAIMKVQAFMMLIHLMVPCLNKTSKMRLSIYVAV